MRVMFVARKFSNMAGGLERISIDLMNAMVKRGHVVALMTWDRKDAVTHYVLDPCVQWLKLDIGDSETSASLGVKLARIMRFRAFVSSFNPHVILGFQSGAALFSRIATLGIGTKIIAAERVSPDMWKYVRLGFINRITDIYSLVLADRITVQFPSYIAMYPRVLRKKMVAIHNPVFEQGQKNSHAKKRSGRVLLYVARLCFQKNHQLLIDAFSKICDDFPDWKLVLVGDGEYDSLLRDKVARLGLGERILFSGAVKDVDTWYQSADLVAFPSLFEGFPNSLSESLSWGLPSVGLKKTLGVNCLIDDGVNGVLTDGSVDDFANGLAALMGDDMRRASMSEQAREIGARYSPEKAYNLWEALIREVATCY
jgi:glycosyltransferase involved in cell wall biosynthesis